MSDGGGWLGSLTGGGGCTRRTANDRPAGSGLRIRMNGSGGWPASPTDGCGCTRRTAMTAMPAAAWECA